MLLITSTYVKENIVDCCVCNFCRHFNTVDANVQRESWTLLLKGNVAGLYTYSTTFFYCI